LGTALDNRHLAEVNVADSAADEEGVVVVVAGAGVSVFNFSEGSATSGIPVNSLTSLVEVVVEGMVRTKAKDLVDPMVDEEGEEDTAVAEEVEAMEAVHQLAEEAEVMAAVQHHRHLGDTGNKDQRTAMDSRDPEVDTDNRRGILRTAVSRVAVAVAVALMANREVVEVMVNSHRPVQLGDTGNKDQRTAMDSRDPEVDTDNRVEASRHTVASREVAAVDLMDSHREVHLTATDNKEDLLLAAILNRVQVVDQVDIISRDPGEAEDTVSNQGLATHHLQQVEEDMVNKTTQHLAGTLEEEEVGVAMDSSSNHQLRKTAMGEVEAIPSSTKRDKSKAFFPRYQRIEHMTTRPFQQLLLNKERDSAVEVLPFTPLVLTI